MRVGTDDLGLAHQVLGLRAVHARDGHGQVRRNPEPGAVIARADADFGIHLRIVGDLHLRLAGHEFQRAKKTGRIADGKELFRIGALPAIAAEFLRRAEIDLG